jgi:small subunit ribosomal protein S21|tara:strand:+ start:567 stop:806 length:240 start_codon:yes stop_codon:yes gene_type:complete
MARFNHKKDYEKTGMQVEVKNNDVNRALRKLKKKIAEDGLMQDLRRREFFESKGTKKRKAKEAAIRRYKKQRAKEQDNW